MLEMLVWLDKVCRKHHIPYWLGSGTLLGAVRHKGFIPWDDDVDVEFLREDYPRLLQVLKQECEGSDYALQTHDTDPAYIFTYAKLRDRRSYIEETNHYDRMCRYQGLFIDLFSIEKLPSLLHWISCRTHGHIYKILKNPEFNDQQVMRKSHKLYALNERFIFPVLRFMARLWPSRVYHYSPGIPYSSIRVPQELFPLSEVTFEGHQLLAPHDPDAYLRRMYGNYMKLPDPSTIHQHTSVVRIDGEG